MKRICSLVLSFACGAAIAAPFAFKVENDKPDLAYRCGEKAVFRVTAYETNGTVATAGKLKWTLDNFGPRSVAQGVADLADGNPFVVEGTLDEPGFLRLSVPNPGHRDKHRRAFVWSVGYETARIRAGATRPADFDEWWAGERARLAKEVPFDLRIAADERHPSKICDTYRLSAATFNGKRVYGFLAVPKEKGRKWPVRVTVPGAGPGVVAARTERDAIVLMMNVHPFEPAPDAAAQKKRLSEENAKWKKDYGIDNFYVTSIGGINKGRGDYFFHDMMLGMARLVDWVATRPDAAGEVTYSGGSQGGGFGLYLTYLCRDRFTRAYYLVPALCDHLGHRLGRLSGWPRYLNSGMAPRVAVEANAPYYDGCCFAAGITCPVRVYVGLGDNTCPPASAYAMFNALKSADKKIIRGFGVGHVRTPAVVKMLDAWERGGADVAISSWTDPLNFR